MKKIKKRLELSAHTMRILTILDIGRADGGDKIPLTASCNPTCENDCRTQNYGWTCY